MLTLGLDPSLRSYGWAVYDSLATRPSDKRVASGHEGTLASTVPIVRFMHFRALVRSLLKKFAVDAVGIESPAYGGGVFSERHFGLMLYSLEAIFEARKNCVLFDPATLKFLVEKGSATKTDVQRYVQLDTMSTKAINNDEADSYCIAKFTSRFIDTKIGKIQPENLTNSERRIFLERTKKVKTTSGKKIVKRIAHVFRENSRYFEFSRVPIGSINLPEKAKIDAELLSWLESTD
jgi:Holliday junction resolvasome RuvABC endonuclease subunit